MNTSPSASKTRPAGWIVPRTIPCAVCGGQMSKGKVKIEQRFWTWMLNILALDALFFHPPEGAKSEVVDWSGTELAYRCGKCEAVLITKPDKIGRESPRR
jgi:hypothetical protein